MEFTATVANLGKYNAGILAAAPLSFPTTTEQVQALLREIGVDGLRYEETIILEYSVDLKGIASKLGEFAHIDELNYLASRLSELPQEDREKFAAAVCHGEYADNLQDLINLTYNLDCYSLYATVQTPEEYGRWLIEELQTIQLPEQARDYFDYEAYGEDTSINEDGSFTRQGYIVNNRTPFKEVYDGKHIPEQYKVFQYPIQQKIRVSGPVRSRDSPTRKRL